MGAQRSCSWYWLGGWGNRRNDFDSRENMKCRDFGMGWWEHVIYNLETKLLNF